MKQLFFITIVQSFFFLPLFSMEELLLPRRNTVASLEELSRRSVLLKRPPITVQDCKTFNQYAALSEKQEKKPSSVGTSIKVLLKISLTPDEDSEANLRMHTRDMVEEEEKDSPPTVAVASASDSAKICEYVREDDKDNLQRLAATLWGPAANENIHKIRDAKGRPLLFLAVDCDSGFMVKALIEEFKVPVNQVWEEKTAVDFVRIVNRSYKVQIERYLRDRQGRAFQEQYAELHPHSLHKVAAANLLKYIKKGDTKKFAELAKSLWPEKASERLALIHDRYGHSLLFLAAATDRQDMVTLLAKDFQLPVNEACNGRTVLDVIELLENKFGDFIKLELRKYGARHAEELVDFGDHEKFVTRPDAIPRPVEWNADHFLNFIRSDKPLATINIADLMKHDLDTGTFLIVAAREGLLDLVERLVEKFNAPVNFVHEGKTALDYAIEGGHKKVANYLKKKRAVSGKEYFEVVLGHYKNEPTEIKDLIKATCAKGSFELLFLNAAMGKIFLLRKGNSKLSFNIFNKEGETSFDVAITFQRFLAAYIIHRSGGKRSFQVQEIENLNSDSQYMSNLAVYEAVLAGDQATLAKCINPFTDVNDLLALACHTNKPHIMKFLVETHNADVRYKFDGASTILDMAHANPEIINYLRKKGAKMSWE